MKAQKRFRKYWGKANFIFPKPKSLVQQLIAQVAQNRDIVLDSFAGSGTTGHAVLQLNKEDGGNRRFILVEMDPNISRNVTAERLRKVCNGYAKPDGKQVEGLGGGFRFTSLGETLFNERGVIRETVKFLDLARHVFFTETGEPIPRHVKASSPLIGIYKDTAVYLLYNGILKDKRADGGNVLTQIMEDLPQHDGTKVIYGTACRLSPARLKRDTLFSNKFPMK